MSDAAFAQPRRRYDNTLRRERAGRTRDRIVAAGADLLRESSVRDWRGLTVRAVAARAGVNERTVFRHFPNERALRDAVMHRLEENVGVDLADLHLGSLADVTSRIFRHLGSYPREGRPDLDPTLADANRRQHEALLGAVSERARAWPASDQALAAAVLDVLWAVATYDRLVTAWDLDGEDAIRAATWVIGLVEDAITAGRRPSASEPTA